MVVIVAIKGFRMGQCASHFAREPPRIVSKLYEVMQNFCKSDSVEKTRRRNKDLSPNQTKFRNVKKPFINKEKGIHQPAISLAFVF